MADVYVDPCMINDICRWEKLQAKMQVVASRRENRLAEMSKRGDHESNMSKDDIKGKP